MRIAETITARIAPAKSSCHALCTEGNLMEIGLRGAGGGAFPIFPSRLAGSSSGRAKNPFLLNIMAALRTLFLGRLASQYKATTIPAISFLIARASHVVRLIGGLLARKDRGIPIRFKACRRGVTEVAEDCRRDPFPVQ